ncbi:MAG: TIGR02206 family membrane protein [Saprospiraceae bacterium]|nr:TIGR02206 family membrane protein [Saprospiraceae bacterium]
MDTILLDNGNFTNYGTEHLICFISTILFIAGIIYLGKYKWNEKEQKIYITIICILAAFTQIFKVSYKYQSGIFDTTNDIPLHLCNIMTLVMPFIMWSKSKTAWSLVFFWIIAGCAQSIFTPTLTESLPHYEAVRYWLVHGVIILSALYGHFVYGFNLTVKDAVRSAIGLNLLALVIFPINLFFGSNYMYLNGKPAGKTFYDLLGEWPGYIITLEFVVIAFFAIILIPFYWTNLKVSIRQKLYF